MRDCWLGGEITQGGGAMLYAARTDFAVVDVMRPTPDDTVVDPAVGTGGLLLAAHKYVVDRHGGDLGGTRGVKR